MTIFGWDSSHYDGNISKATVQEAISEGIVFATGKIGEGGNYVDPLYQNNITAFRDGGMDLLGAYYVVRTPGESVSRQVDHCIATADRLTPWWRDYPGWFWQTDLELWGNDNVPASAGISFSDQLRDATGKVVVLYASAGMYGNKLTAWSPGPLWNANYPSSRRAPFKDLYPGDNYVGWRPYSGMTPAILQYASTATIAGMTTCDANAFRGTIDELRALLTGEETMTPAEFLAILKDPAVATQMQALPWQYSGRGLPNNVSSTLSALTGIYNNGDTVEATLATINAKLDALASSSGGVVDMAAVKKIVMDSLNATKLVAEEMA